MYQPRQPGPNAFYAGTQGASEEFGILDPNLAIEPADTPGMVRLFWRSTPNGTWRQGSQMNHYLAAKLYGYRTRPDSSD